MKKILSPILAAIMLLSFYTVYVFAEDNDTIIYKTTEYLEDGSYVVTTLTEKEENANARATATKTGSKTSIIYNSDDEPLVTMKVTASFSYTGASATCTSVSPTYTVHSSSYKMTSATGTKSGNKGTGNFTVKRYVVGIPVQTIEKSITITCSNSGTLS